MSEWLTIGQLIDQLLIGQIAESDDKQWKAKWAESSSTLIFMDGISDHSAIELRDKKRKWRILPTYIPFEDAMAALKEGKAVKLHLEDKDKPPVTMFRDWYKLESRDGLIFKDLFDGKWTIEN